MCHSRFSMRCFVRDFTYLLFTSLPCFPIRFTFKLRRRSPEGGLSSLLLCNTRMQKDPQMVSNTMQALSAFLVLALLISELWACNSNYQCTCNDDNFCFDMSTEKTSKANCVYDTQCQCSSKGECLSNRCLPETDCNHSTNEFDLPLDLRPFSGIAGRRSEFMHGPGIQL